MINFFSANLLSFIFKLIINFIFQSSNLINHKMPNLHTHLIQRKCDENKQFVVLFPNTNFTVSRAKAFLEF